MEPSTWEIISSIGTAFGAIATFLTVLLVLYSDNLKNFLNPINLSLQSVHDCESFEEVYGVREYYLDNQLYLHKYKRMSTFYYLKIENLTKSRSIKNVSVKYTGYKLLHRYEEFNDELPKYLIHSPISQNNKKNDINDYLYIGFLRCYNENNTDYIDLCTDEIKPIYNSFADEGIKSVRLEIEAEGLLFDKVYEVIIDWNRNSIDCKPSINPSFNFLIKEISESFSRTSYIKNKINKSFEKLN